MNLCLWAVVLSYLLSVSGVAQQQPFAVFADPSDIYPLPSSVACAQALSAPIYCPETLVFAIPSSTYPLTNLTASDLDGLCTQTCYKSLANTIIAVDAACTGWPYIIGDTSYVASLPFRFLAYNWNLSCITDGSDYCVNLGQSDPSTTEPDDPLSSAVACATCYLNSARIQMSSPFGWDANFVSDWDTVQTECGVSFGDAIPASLVLEHPASNATSYNVTATPVLPPASTENCAFGTLIVKANDSCTSIAAAKSLSEDQLISINGLDLNCTKLPPVGDKLCSSGSCKLHTVAPGDTCVKLYTAQDITWAQLLAWNPQLDSTCSNIDTQVGKTICISPPAGDYSPSTTISPVTGSPTAVAVPTGVVAPGSDRTICGGWYEAVPGDTCPQILSVFQITNDTFYALNPLVNEDCSNLLAGFEYCIAVFGNTTTTSAFPDSTPTGASLLSIINGDFPLGTGYIMAAPNITVSPTTVAPTETYASTATPSPSVAPGTVTDGCLQYYTVRVGDSCLGIEIENDLTDVEFRTWNPQVDANCGNIIIGLAYCIFGPYVPFTPTTSIGTSVSSTSTSTSTSGSQTTTSPPVPTNIAGGTITTGCSKYYTVQSGDSCSTIDAANSITLTEFLTWNPEVNVQCTNVQLGLAYCVAGPPPTSSPTLPGTVAGCPTYYTVKSGDTCAVMESQYGITLDQIRQWNTEIDANCANIQPGIGYCVSGPPLGSGSLLPSQGCTDYYTVQPGDTCTVIDTTKGITLAQFLAWNPEVNSQCSNIQGGVQYCVSGPASSTTTPAPAPTGPGTISPGQGCTKYYTVMSGDNCSVIDAKFGITLAKFIKWNPEINAACTNLQLGVQYCVAGP